MAPMSLSMYHRQQSQSQSPSTPDISESQSSNIPIIALALAFAAFFLTCLCVCCCSYHRRQAKSGGRAREIEKANGRLIASGMTPLTHGQSLEHGQREGLDQGGRRADRRWGGSGGCLCEPEVNVRMQGLGLKDLHLDWEEQLPAYSERDSTSPLGSSRTHLPELVISPTPGLSGPSVDEESRRLLSSLSRPVSPLSTIESVMGVGMTPPLTPPQRTYRGPALG